METAAAARAGLRPVADEDDDDLTEDEADSSEDELQKRFDRMTFVVATRKLEQQPQWVKVTDVFKFARNFLKSNVGIESPALLKPCTSMP